MPIGIWVNSCQIEPNNTLSVDGERKGSGYPSSRHAGNPEYRGFPKDAKKQTLSGDNF